MPRPRFSKLPEEKREQLLEAAAKEFAAHGFEHASINRILEQAGVSKGAAYYYFDDKADLFVTVIVHYSKYLVGLTEIDLESLTRETFWQIVEELYLQPFLRAREMPWLLGAIYAVGSLSPEMRTHAMMGTYVEDIWKWAWALIRRGQELGAIRTDLPDDLLAALIVGINKASDDWLLDHLDELELDEIRDIVTRNVDIFKRAFSPQ